VYNVCLAVSNPRGMDTLCRDIQVIINSTNEAGNGISANISPNPVGEAVAANLFADLGASANKFAGTVSLRDALGREVLREPLRVVDGKVRQELKVGHLMAGVYFCVVEDAGVVVWQGKLVKQ